MRFILVDRIVIEKPGRAIEALKSLTLGEEYLADHFPTFPVMPGVLMLESLVEAGAWLLRVSHNFEKSLIVLHEVRNIKYAHFVEPGQQMRVSVDLLEENGPLAMFKGQGEVEGKQTVSAKFTLRSSNMCDRNPELGAIDERLRQHFREQYRLLSGHLKAAAVAS
jgi:3-hydroxyacyl-[acyl-carrier-protein] dehydratase